MRVLIADDNEDAAETLAVLLRMEGLDVHVAHDGAQALHRYHQLAPHVAILDIGMPELSGFQVAEEIRRTPHSAQSYLIALTGWGQSADIQRALSAGFNRHLTKPADPEELLAAIQQALGWTNKSG